MPMINLHAKSHPNTLIELLAPEDDIVTPTIAMTITESSMPYIFLRPYKSARKPKQT
jgi:hypothetical protein